jgi:hypothetical protein
MSEDEQRETELPMAKFERWLITLTAEDPASARRISIRDRYLLPADPTQRDVTIREVQSLLQRDMLESFQEMREGRFEWSFELEREPLEQ